MSQSRNYRVIVADDDGQVGRRLTDFLKEKNFDAKQCSNGEDLKKMLREPEWVPHFILADLVLPGCNAIELCGLSKSIPHLSANETKVLVISAHNSLQNIKDCLKAGAADYILKPFKFEDMIQRLIFHIQKKRMLPEAEREDTGRLQGGDLYLHLLEIVLKEATTSRKLSDTLFNLTKMMAITLKAVRCNIVQTSEDRLTGTIQASSDDRAATGIKIDLSRYPEIHHVMNTEKPVVIENMESDPVLAEIKKLFKNVSFNSMMVCPLKKRGEFYGIMAARMDKSAGGFTDRDIRFAQLMAHVISLTISADLPLPIELRTPA
jgi:DNA-binding response OmpR family regulator